MRYEVNRYIHTGPADETTTERAERLGFPEGTRVRWFVEATGKTLTGTVVSATKLGDMLRVALDDDTITGKYSPGQLEVIE